MNPHEQPRRTLPFAWYSDPAVYSREQERVFRRRWQYVGHTGQVPEPGTMSTSQCGDVPVLLVRNEEGVLRAFLNVCRHRGTRLVSADAKRASIQCPYHAWTYDLDGRLRSAPRSDGEAGFDMDALGLVPLRVSTWGPFIFVNPDPDAEPLEATLEGLPDAVAAAGVDVNALDFRHRSVSAYEANWKICCENFLECYHCQIAHPDLANVIDVSEESYRLEEDRWYSSQFGAVRPDWTGDFDPRGSIGHGQFHFLYPNVTVNIIPGTPNISIGPVIPVSPQRTSRFLDYFFARDADEAWVRDFLEWDDAVGREDTVLVENVQIGVSSGVLDRGVLLESERLIGHFDRLLMEDVD